MTLLDFLSEISDAGYENPHLHINKHNGKWWIDNSERIDREHILTFDLTEILFWNKVWNDMGWQEELFREYFGDIELWEDFKNGKLENKDFSQKLDEERIKIARKEAEQFLKGLSIPTGERVYGGKILGQIATFDEYIDILRRIQLLKIDE